MGQPHATVVDSAGVRALASQLDDIADIVEGIARTQLSRLTFDGATAGRAHAAAGDALHTALNRLGVGVTAWSRSAMEISMALRASADRYVDTDSAAAARLT